MHTETDANIHPQNRFFVCFSATFLLNLLSSFILWCFSYYLFCKCFMLKVKTRPLNGPLRPNSLQHIDPLIQSANTCSAHSTWSPLSHSLIGVLWNIWHQDMSKPLKDLTTARVSVVTHFISRLPKGLFTARVDNSGVLSPKHASKQENNYSFIITNILKLLLSQSLPLCPLCISCFQPIVP